MQESNTQSCHFIETRVTWLAFTQPQSRILGQHWVLKPVNSELSPAFRNRFQGNFQICVARWGFVYKYKGLILMSKYAQSRQFFVGVS